MLEEFDAVYRDGVFVPETPCHLADNTKVRVVVGEADARVQPALISDPVERQRIIEETLARMRANPIPPGAPLYGPNVTPPRITDPEERKRAVAELYRMMEGYPMPADAPKLTREEMHERR
jgi:hypothetical protein